MVSKWTYKVSFVLCFTSVYGSYIEQIPNPAEEHRSLKLHAAHKDENVTIEWLLNGIQSNKSADFFVYDGMMRIENVHRKLNGSVITYRTVHDNGTKGHAQKFTLNVHYGPSWPLIFTPATTFYSIIDGDPLPDITCAVDCNPSCRIQWNNHSNNHVLSLGNVSKNSTGEYVCTASRQGSSVTVNRSVYIHVLEKVALTQASSNPSDNGAIAALATVQVLMALCFGAFCTWVWFRLNGTDTPCASLITSLRKQFTRTKPPEEVTKSSSEKDLEHYAPLDSSSRTAPVSNTYEVVQTTETQIAKSKPDAVEPTGEEFYENM